MLHHQAAEKIAKNIVKINFELNIKVTLPHTESIVTKFVFIKNKSVQKCVDGETFTANLSYNIVDLILV